MIGVLHIAVAMKPVERNFSNNALKHGVAGFNIDEGRVSTVPECPGSTPPSSVDGRRGSMAGPMDRVPYDPSQGRWPANVIMGHSPECAMRGVKKVSASGSWCRTDGARPFNNDGEVTNHEEWQGANDADGKETIQDWDCSPECSVLRLDKQSGVRKSGKPGFRRKPHDTHSMSGRLAVMGRRESGVGDTGGASRFFKQVGEYDDGKGR